MLFRPLSRPPFPGEKREEKRHPYCCVLCAVYCVLLLTQSSLFSPPSSSSSFFVLLFPSPSFLLPLLPSSSYQYRVRAHNKVGWSDFGIISDEFITEYDKPEAPTLCIVLGVKTRSMMVRWDKPLTNGAVIEAYELHCRQCSLGTYIL